MPEDVNRPDSGKDEGARSTGPQLVVGIATAGRPSVAARTVRRLLTQTRQPNRVIVCVPDQAEFDRGLLHENQTIDLLVSGRGLTRQRNAILGAVGPDDLLLYLDDDFVMADDYLAEIETLFRTHADVAVATGTLAADGIRGPGIDYDKAEAIVAGLPAPGGEALSAVFSGYGCNMAIRVSAAVPNGLRFDENLPLYGWLEDVDFCRRILKYGRIVRSNRLRGVHMGIKSGRQRGVKLGYSQVANPIYLLRGGVVSRRMARKMISRNMTANLFRSFKPEPWSDRRGRLRGNLLAIRDYFIGTLHPNRVLELE